MPTYKAINGSSGMADLIHMPTAAQAQAPDNFSHQFTRVCIQFPCKGHARANVAFRFDSVEDLSITISQCDLDNPLKLPKKWCQAT
jgi:hypothetical protein